MDADSPRETELKLLVAPGDLGPLRRHPRLRALAQGPPSTRRVLSTYFDTEDLDLLRAGFGLRLRRVGRATVQTLKARAAHQAGLFVRGEWEAPVRGRTPDLAAIPDAALREELARLVGPRPLAARLWTDVRRTRRVLRDEAFEILCDLDVGEVRTAAQSLPICELELELVRGEPAALFDLAIEIQETLALRPAIEDKAERGFALLGGEGLAARGAARPELTPESTLDDALAEIMAACTGQIALHEAAAREGEDPEGVHQMRVAVRRLRSALALFDGVIPDAQSADFEIELRWLADALGEARDLDVFLDETLAPLVAASPGDPALKRLREVARELRDERQSALRTALDSPRLPRLLLRLGRWTVARDWRAQDLSADSARLFAPARALAGELLARRRRKLRRLGARLEELSPAEKHRLRIQVKKLRYAAEFFAGLYPQPRTRRAIRRLARLQDVLGHLNDRATADTLLDRVLTRLGREARPEHHRAAGLVSGWTARGAEAQLGRLERRWASVEKSRPFWRS
jgi:inorganic triphosphatase YgiF